MTEEIMPREDRMGKILTFIGGCLAGVIGVFTVAAIAELSEMSPNSTSSDDSEIGGLHDGIMPIPESNNNSGK